MRRTAGKLFRRRARSRLRITGVRRTHTPSQREHTHHHNANTHPITTRTHTHTITTLSHTPSQRSHTHTITTLSHTHHHNTLTHSRAVYFRLISVRLLFAYGQRCHGHPPVLSYQGCAPGQFLLSVGHAVVGAIQRPVSRESKSEVNMACV